MTYKSRGPIIQYTHNGHIQSRGPIIHYTHNAYKSRGLIFNS